MNKYEQGSIITRALRYPREHKARVLKGVAFVAAAVLSLHQLTLPVNANNGELEPQAYLPYIVRSAPTPTPTLERPTPGSPPSTPTLPPFPTRTSTPPIKTP